MDALGNPLPEQPSGDLTNISTKKLSPVDLLLQYGNVDNDVRKMLEQPITQKGFNGLGFDR